MYWTFKDAIQALRDYVENKTGQTELRRVKRAIYDALRDIAGAHRWRYLTSLYQFSTVDAYDTGTIAYDHTGGSAERILTLTTGTWPSWAGLGTVLIDGVPYKALRRISSSVLQLGVNTNPGADVSSGTAYTLYQDCYPLPETFLSLESVISLSQNAILGEIDTEELSHCARRFITPSNPLTFTIMGDPNYKNRQCLCLSPPPLAADTLEVMLHRMPSLPRIEQYADGTVSNSAASATLTGSGTAWTSAMIGASVRLSTTNEIPTNDDGDNPADEERTIIDVASATSLTVDSPFTGAHSGVGHAISDIIDIDQVTMLNAFQRGCESQIMLNAQNRSAIRGWYEEELQRARSADNKSVGTKVAGASVRRTNYKYPPVDWT